MPSKSGVASVEVIQSAEAGQAGPSRRPCLCAGVKSGSCLWTHRRVKRSQPARDV